MRLCVAAFVIAITGLSGLCDRDHQKGRDHQYFSERPFFRDHQYFSERPFSQFLRKAFLSISQKGLSLAGRDHQYW